MKSQAELEKEVSDLRSLLQQRDQRIASLEELLKLSRIERFGPSSEKSDSKQLGLFDEAESIASENQQDSCADESVKVTSHMRRAKPRVSIPEDLPREEILYELDEAERICPHDGAELKVIGSEDHEQLDIIPAKIKVIKHRRLKYACPCCNKHMATAKKPKQAIEKCIASPGLLSFIAVQKYIDSLPLYRQGDIFNRLGINLNRSNLSQWMIRTGELVQPLINLLAEQLQQRQFVHMDETTVQVLKEPDKPPTSKSYMWLMGSFTENPIVLFHYSPSRRESVAVELLSESVPAIMVDGYSGYNEVCRQYAIERLGCWAHARRYFVKAQKLQKKGKTGKADVALAKIAKLYAIEKRAKGITDDKRLKLRQEQSKVVLEELRQWLEKTLPNTVPSTKLGEALIYLKNQWANLARYCNNGAYPIDNNPAENAIRPFAIGRKNWMFSHSVSGAKASANLYGLLQTARLNGRDPYDYLRRVFSELPNAESVEDVEALLPWNVPQT